MWCTIYRREGRQKNECPEIASYATTGALDPFPRGNVEYCEICKNWGHNPRFCTLLEKYQKTYHSFLQILQKYGPRHPGLSRTRANEGKNIRCVQNTQRSANETKGWSVGKLPTTEAEYGANTIPTCAWRIRKLQQSIWSRRR